jgi:hypothetical protein
MHVQKRRPASIYLAISGAQNEASLWLSLVNSTFNYPSNPSFLLAGQEGRNKQTSSLTTYSPNPSLLNTAACLGDVSGSRLNQHNNSTSHQVIIPALTCTPSALSTFLLYLGAAASQGLFDTHPTRYHSATKASNLASTFNQLDYRLSPLCKHKKTTRPTPGRGERAN